MSRDASGILGCPVKPGNDGGGDVSERSRDTKCPSSASSSSLEAKRAQGRPGVLRTHSRACSEKSTRVSHYRSAETIRPSLRNGLNGLCSCSPRCTGLLATVACRSSPTSLIPASGDQDHTISPYANCAVRPTANPRPPHPAANVRDDRDTPLFSAAGCADHTPDFIF